MDIYTLRTDNVWKLNYNNLQSTFQSTITIFNGSLDTFIVLRIFFINCIVSFQGGCRSYYKLMYCYYCIFIHLPMVFPFINQLEMMIYDTVEIKNPNVKFIGYIYDQNTYRNIGNIDSGRSLNCPSIDHILLMIYLSMNHYQLTNIQRQLYLDLLGIFGKQVRV